MATLLKWARRVVVPKGTSAVDVEVWNEGLLLGVGWRELRDGKAQGSAEGPDVAKRFLEEEHHRFYGRPWCTGRAYFDFLIAHGLLPRHRVLDFGCGAGRLGIWLIPYLDAGHYVGVDHHWEAVAAFARYEAPLHGLAERRPRLVLDGSLDVTRLAQTFDVILDCFVSFHLTWEDRMKLYRGFVKALQPNGRIFLPHAPTLERDDLAKIGLSVIHDQVVQSQLLVGRLPDKKTKDHWHILGRL
ncbi:MAG: class I SAM-dependent methyltransferase [Phycisphaeraceae bacterium]